MKIDLDAIERRRHTPAGKKAQAERDAEYARIMAARGEPLKPLSKPPEGRMVGRGRRGRNKQWEPIRRKPIRKKKKQSVVTVRTAPSDTRPKKVYTTPQGKAYEAYINSDAWAKKRLEYWRRAGYSCKAKGCGASQNLHVHHHTYERLGNERMSDLIGLCHAHHDQVHDFHKQNRGMTLTEATSRVTQVKI